MPKNNGERCAHSPGIGAEKAGPLHEVKLCFALEEPPRLISAGGDVEGLLGYSVDELLRNQVRLQDRIHPGDSGLAQRLFSPASGQESGSCNLRLRHAGGRIRCIRANYTKNSAGEKPGLVLLLEDARSLTGPEDAALEANFSTLIQHTRDIVYVKNLNHVYVAASRALTSLTHSAQSAAELKRKTDYDLFAEGIADVSYRLEEQAIAEGRGTHQLQERTAQDGARHWIDDRKYPIGDAQGETAGILGIAPEITEYIDAELKVRESEESLREAQRMAGLGSYVFDCKTWKWGGSDSLFEVLGIERTFDCSLAGWLSLVHPDDRKRMAREPLRTIQSPNESFSAEYRIIRPSDHAVRWIYSAGRKEFDAQGNLMALRATLQDITDRKQVETALRESKELLQLFIEHAPAALAMLDREMRYLAVSRRWLEMHQLTGQEIVGRSHYEIFPDLPEEWKDEHRRALAGEAILLGESPLPFRGGGKRWARREIRPWFTGEGQIGGIVIFAEEITARKQAECALQESQHKLQLFVEHAPVALAMFDREMRYLALSRRWAQDHGIDEREIVGLSHYEINPVVPERWKETHRRGLAGEFQAVEEDRYDRADGAMQWIRWQIVPWRADDGSVGGIVMFYEDITARRMAEAAVREGKDLLQLFIDRAPAALAMFDREMRYLAVSRRWREEYLQGEGDLIGRSHYEMVPDLPERWREAHRRGLAGETLKAEEERFERADGTVQWVRWEVLPWRAADGSVGGIVLFADDITEQKQVKERLRLAATVFTHAAEGITITDPAGNILEVNEAFTRITGYSREEVLGKNPSILQSGIQSREFYENMWQSLVKNGQWKGEIWNRNKNGEIFAEELAINAIRDAEGKVVQYVALFSDVTQLKERERQLEHVAHFDALTGLPNRSLLADRLRQGMAQAHRRSQLLAVVSLDLDGFKAINDQYGHEIGDRLLTALSRRMHLALREGDTLARLGGDEFAAVLMDLQSADDAGPALDRLLKAASDKVRIGRLNLCVTASIGVALYPQGEETDAEQLLRQAGQALYEAKVGGRDRYAVFNSSRDLSVRGHNQELEHVRSALSRNELVLYYQPKVNMRSGAILGAEALIRWDHPERGLLLPGAFLPLIENDMFSIKLGEWVIDAALTQMEVWQRDGLEIPVSVNVGALQLQQKDFPERLRQLLAAHPDVRPSRLELEVLETSALQDLVQASNVLEACHAIGVSFAIDDFGTGYASLTYLKRLPAQTLKIDQSFVRDMLDDPENPTILEGVLGLANAFRRNTVAEGVETVELGVMLLQLGCEAAQGYGIARPMPAGELPGWIERWRPDPRWTQSPAVHPENRTLLFACVEHRAWLGAFESYLQGRRHAPPPLDPAACRFGAWLDGERLAGRIDPDTFAAIETLHNQLHSLAAEILASQANGHNSNGLARLGALHGLGQEFAERLTSLN